MNPPSLRQPPAEGQRSWQTSELLALIFTRWPLVTFVPLVAGAVAFAISSVWPPTYTARMMLLPPQQGAQSPAAAALASLGNLGALAGGLGGKSSADQYVALMQSTTVQDRIIDQFKLIEVYDVDYRQDARKELGKQVAVVAGKKDGLITVEVDDHDPRRAADIANAHAEQLRWLTNTLAVTEAQQRRVFFEQQLTETRDKLVAAQLSLRNSGISTGDLKIDPKAAAENYARLRASLSNAEIRLRALASMLTPAAPELAQQQAAVSALRAELARAEQPTGAVGSGDPDYVSRLREFKYQETLFEMFARQFELARADEAREGALVQVVDRATPPERRSKPRRGIITLAAAMLALVFVLSWLVLTHQRSRTDRP